MARSAIIASSGMYLRNSCKESHPWSVRCSAARRRHGKGKCGAHPQAAGDLYDPAVRLHYRLGYGKPQPGALPGRLRALGLDEPREYGVLLGGRYPGAGVGDAYLQHPVAAVGGGERYASLIGVLDRVGDQVVEDLREPRGVGAHRPGPRRHHDAHLEPLLGDLAGEDRRCLGEHALELHLLQVEGDEPGVHAGQVQQVPGQPAQPLDGKREYVERALLLVVERPPGLPGQYVEAQLEGGERRAQLVGGDPDEVQPGALQALLFRDVSDHADHELDLSGITFHRRGDRAGGESVAVLVGDPELRHDDGLAGLEYALRVSPQEVSALLPVEVLVVLAGQLLTRISGEIQERLVAIDEAAATVLDPDRLGDVLQHALEEDGEFAQVLRRASEHLQAFALRLDLFARELEPVLGLDEPDRVAHVVDHQHVALQAVTSLVYLARGQADRYGLPVASQHQGRRGLPLRCVTGGAQDGRASH